MIGAGLIFVLAVLLGALLNCALPPPRHVPWKAVYINGREVELMSPERFVSAVDYPKMRKRLVVRRLPLLDGPRIVCEEEELTWHWTADDAASLWGCGAYVVMDGMIVRGITETR